MCERLCRYVRETAESEATEAVAQVSREVHRQAKVIAALSEANRKLLDEVERQQRVIESLCDEVSREGDDEGDERMNSYLFG